MEKKTDTDIRELVNQVRELERAINYYRKLSDEVAGYNILVDSKLVLMKRELQEKKDGFSILSKLHKVIGTNADMDQLMEQTLNQILTTLKMDKGVVLWAEDGDRLRVRWHKGYLWDQEQKFEISMDGTQLNKREQILVNKSSEPDPELDLFHARLALPYMVGVPLFGKGRITGWLIAGREKEAAPFYPALGQGDMFTFHAIGVFLEAAIANILLYTNVEKANRRLEEYNAELERKVQLRTRDIEISHQQLNEEKQKSDELLLNILPEEVASELKQFGKSKARIHNDLTILFTDFVNFTQFAEGLTPEELVHEIDYCFRAFDEIVTKHKLEKIKTIGDAYMCAGGLGGDEDIQVQQAIRAALEMRDFVAAYIFRQRLEGKKAMQIRIGIHHGPGVAGVVGFKKFAFDIWGDTVNIASRLEHASDPGKINVSGIVYELCKDQFDFDYRGEIEAKNKGMIPMYFVEAI